MAEIAQTVLLDRNGDNAKEAAILVENRPNQRYGVAPGGSTETWFIDIELVLAAIRKIPEVGAVAQIETRRYVGCIGVSQVPGAVDQHNEQLAVGQWAAA